MLNKLFRLFKRNNVPTTPKPTKKVRYRIVYPPKQDTSEQETKTEEEKEEEKKEVKSETTAKKRKTSKSSKSKQKKSEDKVEDVEKAIELIKEAGKYLVCPYCRARLLDEIEYLLTYHYKTKLIESGIDPKHVDEIFRERYSDIVKRKIEKIKNELNIGDFEYKQAKIEKAKAMLSVALLFSLFLSLSLYIS